MLTGLNHITLSVSDQATSLQFYQQLLGFQLEVQWGRGAYLSLPGFWLCLSVGEAKPAQDYSHLAFSIDEANFADFTAKLRAARVVEWQQNSSEGASLYFLDPDGHQLEIHCGSLQSRLVSLRQQPYAGLQWPQS
jgi:catechol 2,3-dioxygenase-like lactoylglutathione lyase family enzyme